MAAIADAPQPHSIEAESSVLGAILIENQAWSKAAAFLRPEDFFRVGHQRIFSAMERLVAAGSPIDFTLLREELSKSNDEDEAGGPAYIASLTNGVPRAVNVEHYAAVVRDKSKLRKAYAIGTKIRESALAQDEPSIVVEVGVHDLMQIEQASWRGVVSLRAALADYTASLDGDHGKLIPTGFVDLDDVTGGVERRKLTIIAARPSVGKTSLLLAIADHVSASGIGVGILTLETDPMTLASGLLQAHSGVASTLIRHKAVSSHGWAKITHAMEALDGRPLYFVQDAYTLTAVQAWMRRLVEEHGVQVIGLDYIQLMGEQQSKDRQQEIAYLSRGLKRTASDLDVALIVLSQLSRAPEARADKRPQLSDLRESGALEQDADLVFLLFREEMYKRTTENEGIAEVIIAKNKQGPTGVARLCFIAGMARFENLARDELRY